MAKIKLKKSKTRRRFRGRRNKRAGGIVTGAEQRFFLNPSFDYFNELKTLILKSSPAEKGELIRRVSELGRVKLGVISGVFLNKTDGPITSESAADLFIVGDDLDRRRVRNLLHALEAEMGMEIKLTVMEREEFEYRYGMFDRFVRVLLEGDHEKIINKLGI